MSLTKAKPELYEQLAQVADDYRPDVAELKLKIAVLFAHAPVAENGEPTGPALTKGGYEVNWTAKVTPVDERLTGGPDLRVKINGDRWTDWSESRRVSILDEILHAITICRDPDFDAPILDDANRPKLKLKSFDIMVQGYELVVRRHPGVTLCETELEAVNNRLAQKTMFA